MKILCGEKSRFTSEKAAKNTRRKMFRGMREGKRTNIGAVTDIWTLKVFKCPKCGGWHLGRKSALRKVFRQIVEEKKVR